MEITFELVISGIIIYLIFSIITHLYKCLKGGNLKNEKFGILSEFVINQKEDFEWNGFVR